MSAALMTPEELIDDDDAPLLLDLTCNRCGLVYSGKFEWACVDTRDDPKETAWDGIVLSRIVECAGCGAVDDYTLAPDSFRQLTTEARRIFRWRRSTRRIIRGVSQLWDGSIAHRPSHALAHLRELTAKNPKSAEAFRRLGNACERWRQMEEAVVAWKKAVDLDPAEIEAAYSLAAYWLGPGGRPAEGAAFLRQGIRALPRAAAGEPRRRKLGAELMRLLFELAEASNEPVALMAVWSAGTIKAQPVVNMSSVDLRKLDDFERLVDFVTGADLLGLDLTSELPEDEPTILQRLLAGEAPTTWNVSDSLPTVINLPVVPPNKSGHATRAVSRNAPCPCGSRKRYKRCCGR